ncbi:MAG: NUDIX domain-containing protein [Clostridia bacterium]|nr:NUDIX domain-containing protein [Clostridia bacterium]
MKTVDIFGNNRLPEVKRSRVACRGFLVENDKILICHELKDKQFFSPGGGLEKDESLEECCIREICEETGILVKVKDHLITVNEYYDDWKFISHYYICEAVGKSERKLTNAEIKTGLVPEWVNIEFIRDLWSRHDEFKREETRGSYLREHTALCEYFEVTK